MTRFLRQKQTFFILIILFLGIVTLGCGQSPIYKITLKDADFDTIATLIEAELTGANMNVFTPHLDIQAGMRARGEEFPKYKVFQFCNLTIGKEIFKVTRDFGAFIPCKIYMYEKGDDVVVGTYVASTAMIHLDIPLTGEKADIVEKNIDLIEGEIKSIIDSLQN